MTAPRRDWVRVLGITGATLVVAGAVTLGGLGIARATGLISTPYGMNGGQGFGMMDGGRGERMHGGRGGQGFGMMDDDHGDMMGGGRGGRMRGERGGDGFGMMGDGFGAMTGDGFGMMNGGKSQFAQTQATDEGILLGTIAALQEESALASALVPSNPALQQVVDARTKDIAALTSWTTTWYPDATIPTAPAASGTIEDLQMLVTHNTVHLQELVSRTTLEHSELSTWVTTVLQTRAAEMPILYGSSS